MPEARTPSADLQADLADPSLRGSEGRPFHPNPQSAVGSESVRKPGKLPSSGVPWESGLGGGSQEPWSRVHPAAAWAQSPTAMALTV